MTLSVSDAVYAEVKAKLADHQGAVQLLQNQLDAAQATANEWAAILGEVYVAAPVPVPAPVVDSQPTPADAQGIG